MFGINCLSVKKSKIPRTRRSSGISKDDPLELKQEPCLTSDLHMHDGPLHSEQLRVAPTVKREYASDDEIDSVADDQATSEHGNGDIPVPDKTDDGLSSLETDICTYSNYEVISTMICILSYIFDVGSDVYLAYVYYSSADMWWFTLTVIFIVVPSMIITIFSFVWYIQDRRRRSYSFIWLPRLLLLLLQLGPLLRYIVIWVWWNFRCHCV